MEGFDPVAALLGASPWALATGILLALIRGDLVPRKAHDAVVADRDLYRARLDKQTDKLLDSLQPTQRPRDQGTSDD